MSIYTGLKNDYSFLFSSLSSSGQGSSANLLSNISLTDYNNIKSGTYYKLMKAYYAKKSGENDSYSSVSKSSTDTYRTITDASELKNDAAGLYNAASKLSATGSKSLFTQKDITTTGEDGTKTTTKGYDTESIKSAVKDFVKEYNSLVSSAAASGSSSAVRAAGSMKNLTQVFSSQLSKVGITVGTDSKLTLDEEAFDSADMSKVKTLFNGANSYAGNVGGYASSIGSYANAALNSGNTYTSSGSYSALQSGINYNSFF